jgi:hypothetical protein
MVRKPPSIRYIAVPESPCSAAGFRLPRNHQNWPRAQIITKIPAVVLRRIKQSNDDPTAWMPMHCPNKGDLYTCLTHAPKAPIFSG